MLWGSVWSVAFLVRSLRRVVHGWVMCLKVKYTRKVHAPVFSITAFLYQRVLCYDCW